MAIPFLKWVFFLALVAYFVYVVLCIATTGSPIVLGTEFNKPLTDSNMNQYLMAYHVFGSLWGVAFIFGVGQITIAGAAATYYFTLNKKKLPMTPVLTSFYRVFRYHLGSVALGSLLVAIVQFLRILLWYFTKRARQTKAPAFLQYIFACIQCCLGCVEKIFKWINKNAYIHIAINGTSFCTSAATAFGLVVRNALRTLAVDFVSDFVLFLGKLAVSAAIFFASWAILQWRQTELNLNYTFAPAIIIAVEAYVISHIFMGVYHMVIDTIFLCFLEDAERNDGSAEKPYFMPDSLRRQIKPKQPAMVQIEQSAPADD